MYTSLDLFMEVLYFIRDNWQYISSGIVILITIIAIIIKKRPVQEVIDPGVFHKLVDLVIQAENKFGSGNGADKLAWVVRQFYLTGGSEIINSDVVCSIVEYILTTPEKKGVSREEVK